MTGDKHKKGTSSRINKFWPTVLGDVVGVAGLVDSAKTPLLRDLFLVLIALSSTILAYQIAREVGVGSAHLLAKVPRLFRSSRPATTSRFKQSPGAFGKKSMQRKLRLASLPPFPADAEIELGMAVFKVGARITCHRRRKDKVPSSSRTLQAFRSFLTDRACTTLIDMVAESDDSEWKTYKNDVSPNGDVQQHGLQLIDTATEVCVAYADISLPKRKPIIYRRKYAIDFMLVIRVPERSDVHQRPGLGQWQLRLAWALAIPEGLTVLLKEQLNLGTADHPPAQIAVQIISSATDLTQLMDVAGLDFPQASQPEQEFNASAIGSRSGEAVWAAARSWMEQLCDTALHAYNYEKILDAAGALADYAPVLYSGIPRRKALVTIGLGTVALSVIVLADQLISGPEVQPSISKGRGGGVTYEETTTTAPPFSRFEPTTTTTAPPLI